MTELNWEGKGFLGGSDSKESACSAGDGSVEMISRMTPWCLVCVTRKFKLLLPEMGDAKGEQNLGQD